MMATLYIEELFDVVFSICLKWHFAFNPYVLFSELDQLWQHLLGRGKFLVKITQISNLPSQNLYLN